MVLVILADKAGGHSAMSLKYFHEACLECQNCYQKAPENKVLMIIPRRAESCKFKYKLHPKTEGFQ